MHCSPPGSSVPWGNSPGKNTGVCSLSVLQGIFPTQGSNPGLPHCRWILYQLSHQGSPRRLEWVAYAFSSRSSLPRTWTGVSCIASGFFTSWATREARLRQGRGLFAKQSGKEMKDLLPILKIVLFVFFILSCLTVYIFWILMVYYYFVCIYFLLFSTLSFSFVSGSLLFVCFCCKKILRLIQLHLFIFAFVSFPNETDLNMRCYNRCQECSDGAFF